MFTFTSHYAHCSIIMRENTDSPSTADYCSLTRRQCEKLPGSYPCLSSIDCPLRPQGDLHVSDVEYHLNTFSPRNPCYYLYSYEILRAVRPTDCSLICTQCVPDEAHYYTYRRVEFDKIFICYNHSEYTLVLSCRKC